MKKIKAIPVFGDISEDVKIIQNQLFDLGFRPIQIDGGFGDETKNRISEFQKHKGLPGSGTIGPKTIGFLDIEVDPGYSVESVVNIATFEWEYWKKQEIIESEKKPDGSYKLNDEGNTIPIFAKIGKREIENHYYQRVGKYWEEGVNNTEYNGKTNVAWSAAFISYVLRKAGVGSKFFYNEQHSKYIRKAILAKLNGDSSYGFWGYKLNDYAPQIGDLVCYVRANSKAITYDSPTNDYESHSDIVVGKEAGILKVIGGNVENSVTLKHVNIDGNGFINDKQKKWFAVLKNKIN